jgi:MerR family copper efflux transcriptional regulator
MVKQREHQFVEQNMLISEFAKTSALSVDTVRFYIRQGLLSPTRSSQGGLRGYQEFGPDELRIAAGIRIGRLLGLSLADIKIFIVDGRSRPKSIESRVRLMETHRAHLQERLIELQKLLGYMDKKIDWMKGGGDEPVWPSRSE